MIKRIVNYLVRQYKIRTMSPSRYARSLGVKVGDDCSIGINYFGG